MHGEAIACHQPHPAEEVHPRPEAGGPLARFFCRFSLPATRARGIRHQTTICLFHAGKRHRSGRSANSASRGALASGGILASGGRQPPGLPPLAPDLFVSYLVKSTRRLTPRGSPMKNSAPHGRGSYLRIGSPSRRATACRAACICMTSCWPGCLPVTRFRGTPRHDRNWMVG